MRPPLLRALVLAAILAASLSACGGGDAKEPTALTAADPSAPTLTVADVAQQTTTAAVTVNPTTSYGFGWLISTRSWANGKVLFHDGSNGANHSLTFVAPVRNVAFLATTNGYDAGGRSSKALDALIGRLNVFHITGR